MAEEKKVPEQKKPVEQTAAPEIKTCATCSKPLRKVKRYYRNGKYYCNKNCWYVGQKGSEEAPKG